MTNEPLVSVVVITYNSGDYITETLDSIYNQTYRRIELVISDDASTDNTVAAAQEWIEAHKDRFEGCFVRASKENQGIPQNINAGIRCTHGKYYKLIAGDDILLENCVQDNVEGCAELGSPYLFTWLVKFTDTEKGRKFWEEQPNLRFFAASAQEQYRMLMRKNYVYGPLFFCEKAFWEQMDMYDETYRMLEDYPMWLKMTSGGHKLCFKNIPTVAYRISQTSVTNGSGQRVVNVNYFKCYRQFFYDKLFPTLVRKGMLVKLLLHWRDFAYKWIMIWLGNDRGKNAVRFVEYFHQRKYLHRNHG